MMELLVTVLGYRALVAALEPVAAPVIGRQDVSAAARDLRPARSTRGSATICPPAQAQRKFHAMIASLEATEGPDFSEEDIDDETVPSLLAAPRGARRARRRHRRLSRLPHHLPRLPRPRARTRSGLRHRPFRARRPRRHRFRGGRDRAGGRPRDGGARPREDPPCPPGRGTGRRAQGAQSARGRSRPPPGHGKRGGAAPAALLSPGGVLRAGFRTASRRPCAARRARPSSGRLSPRRPSPAIRPRSRRWNGPRRTCGGWRRRACTSCTGSPTATADMPAVTTTGSAMKARPLQIDFRLLGEARKAFEGLNRAGFGRAALSDPRLAPAYRAVAESLPDVAERLGAVLRALQDTNWEAAEIDDRPCVRVGIRPALPNRPGQSSSGRACLRPRSGSHGSGRPGAAARAGSRGPRAIRTGDSMSKRWSARSPAERRKLEAEFIGLHGAQLLLDPESAPWSEAGLHARPATGATAGFLRPHLRSPARRRTAAR